ncbi:MAG: hypothetical protein ACRDLF_04870 [Solirubrobacteraceae bacterium]
MDLTSIHSVQSKSIICEKGLRFSVEPLAQETRQLARVLAANLPHDKEHGVLHGRVVDSTPGPDPSVKKDVKKRSRYPHLPLQFFIGVADAQRREKHRILKSEVVLSVVVDRLEAGCLNRPGDLGGPTL